MSQGDDRIVRSKFRNYLISRCDLTYGTATSYIWTLNVLSEHLEDSNIIDDSIYSIKNIHQLLDLKTKLADSEVFRTANDVCKGRLTPGLRHYYDFMVASSESDHVRHYNTKVAFQRENKRGRI